MSTVLELKQDEKTQQQQQENIPNLFVAANEEEPFDLISKKGVLPRQGWVPDEQCSQCFQCQAPFTLSLRRHHCRACGLVFCYACSSQKRSGKNNKTKTI